MKPTILNPRARPGDRLLDDLLFCALLHEGCGSTTYDPITGHQAAFLVNAAWTSGKYGAAVAFDGADGTRLEMTAPPTTWNDTHRGQHTYAAWVRIDGSSGGPSRLLGHSIVSRGAGHPLGFIFGVTDVGPMALRWHANSEHLTSPYTMNLLQWYHVAVVVDELRNEVRLYLDGKGSIHSFSGWTANPGAALRIGGNGNNDRMNGVISDLWGWERSLSVGEIMEHKMATYRPFRRYSIWEQPVTEGSAWYYRWQTSQWAGGP